MRRTRIVSGSFVAILGVFLIGSVILGSAPALLANHLFNSVLWASIGILLLAFSAVILFR
jgi:hypothetical protein